MGRCFQRGWIATRALFLASIALLLPALAMHSVASIAMADDQHNPARSESALAAGEIQTGETVIREAGAIETTEVDRFTALVDAHAPTAELARNLQAQEPADAADSLETLESSDSAEVLHSMDDEAAAEALANMELPLAAGVIEDLPADEAARYLALMDPDDAADLLQSVDNEQAQLLLANMPRLKAATLAQLAVYDPETAGGLMTTDLVRFAADSSIGQAIQNLRIHAKTDFAQTRVYCVDNKQRLAGAITLRALLLNDPEKRIKDVMDAEVPALRPEIDREDVARAFDRYDYLDLPVIDEHQRLLGVVTIDDVIDIIREEHTEDAFRQVGVTSEAESVYASLTTKIRSRFPWLLINLGMATMAALVVLTFEGLIDEIAILAVIMPIIANQAGNAGHQSLAVTLRGIVLKEVRRGRTGPLLMRETLLGLFSGAVIGFIIGLALAVMGAAGLHDEAGWKLGAIAAISMAGSLSIGCFVGTAIPLVLDRLRFDPATGSSIFVTMLTDTASFFTFLGLAYRLQGWLNLASG